LAWTLEYSAAAQKALRKLDRQTNARILNRLAEISQLEDPHSRGKSLTGKLTGLGRYRVDDWRVIVRIEGQRLVILVLTVGNRREIYRGR
jgi:mRNA interferase RelE/StbE